MALPKNSATTNNSRQRIRELDGIRGIAILFVLIWHYVVSKIEPPAIPWAAFTWRAFNFTFSGVDLFFVLSGFLIGGILLDHRESRNYFQAFYARRVARIFPVYFVWLFLFVISLITWPELARTSSLHKLFENPLPLWTYATFTQNIAMALRGDYGSEWLGVTWSLAIEEQFYLTLPLTIRFISMRKLPYVLMTLIALAPILRVLAIYPPPHLVLPGYVLTPLRVDGLLMGVLAAILVRQKDALQNLSHHIQAMHGIFIALTALVIGAIVLGGLDSYFWISLGYSLLGLAYASLILIALAHRGGWIAAIARNSVLCFFGELSYGMYLFHQAMNDLAHGLILNQMPQLHSISDLLVSAVALFMTILVAYFSWHGFEKKIVVFGHSFDYG